MSLKRTIIASGLMIFTMVFLRYVGHAENIHPNKPFSTFPKEIGEWSGKETFFDDKIYQVLGVDDSYLAYYTAPNERQVQLYIGFYQSQKEGELIHSPKNCMPGGGWNITNVSLEPIQIPGRENPVEVIRLKLKNGPHQQMVLYWYHSRGRVISSEYWQKIYLVIDSIAKHRTDGSFVRLIAPVEDGDEEQTIQNLKDFASKLFPILNQYTPS